MDPYRCYYCDITTTTQKEILSHSIQQHFQCELKYKKYELSSVSGRYGYRTLNYKIIPSELEKVGKKITVDNHGLVINKPTVLMSPSTASPAHKKIRKENDQEIKAKVKLFDTSANNLNSEECQTTSTFLVEEDGEVEEQDEHYSILTNMLPAVITFLKENNQLDQFTKFFELVSNKKFPPNQIAYLLFLDVVQLLALDDIRQMRYSDEIKLFWRIGSKLFHGRFLRFMSGEKSTADFLGDSPSPFNFAVPSRSILQSNQVYQSCDIKPGLLPHILDMYSGAECSKSFKLCVDGKKINMASNSKIGGVNLFGYEDPPPAADRIKRLQSEDIVVSEIGKYIKMISDSDFTELQTCIDVHPNLCSKILSCMKECIPLLSLRISDLRQMKVKKSLTLKKLKDIGGSNWRNSKYSFAISAIHTSLYQIEETIDECITVIDDIGLACAIIQKSDRNYVRGDVAYMQIQENNVCLSGLEMILENGDNLSAFSPFVRQRTESWHEIRNSGKVTGSNINKALGLESLKKQNEYIAARFHGASSKEPTSDEAKRMKYGSENEVNAVSTLTCKILPVLFPDMTFFEEGCYIIKQDDDNFLIVSPDGSCRSEAQKILACEFKCPYPDKVYTTQVHYKIPKYYVTQILSEMYCLQAEQLIYLSYTKETTTAFLVQFDSELWNEVLEELVRVFGVETPQKQSRLSVAAKVLKPKIEDFLVRNVTFLGEYKSIDAIPCSHPSPLSKSSTRVGHASITKKKKKSIKISQLQSTTEKARKLFVEADHLTKLVASEILVFMLSDVDRIYKPEMPHAVPVAYGLKGYSLKSESLRNMIDYVVHQCNASGLHVPVVSFDGQWARIAMRDKDGKPLTVLQLQKDVQAEAKKMTKPEQIKRLMEANRITNVNNIDDVRKVANITITNSEKTKTDANKYMATVVEIGSLKDSTKIYTPRNAFKLLQSKTIRQEMVNMQNSRDYEEVDDDQIDYMLQSIPQEEHSNIDSYCLEAMKAVNPPDFLNTNADAEENVLRDIIIEEESLAEDNDPVENVEIRPDILNMNANGENNVIHDLIEEESTVNGNAPEDHISSNALVQKLQEVVFLLKGTGDTPREKHWINLDVATLQEKLKTADSIYKCFYTKEITLIIHTLSEGKEEVQKSDRKYIMIYKLCRLLDIKEMENAPKRRQANPLTLRNLCKRVVSSKISKDVLNIVFATNMMPGQFDNFQMNGIFTEDVKLKGLNQPHFWFSQPLTMGDTQITFPILDNEHLLVNTRVKCCSSGMSEAGISKEAWLKVARECSENGTGLTLAHVEDIIDKQSCAFALKTFSCEVEEAMRRNGDINEANFAKLIREWYEAEDKPGLSPMDRISRRLNLRSWLLSDIDFKSFPAPGLHVKGIPIVLYEGFLTNIERHIQLYSYVKGGTYNARSIGTLDIENFFGEFSELDPKGNGILRPDDIPTALATACEILHARMDTSRCFSMRTSTARPYPVKDLTPNGEMEIEDDEMIIPSQQKPTEIITRFHLFDTPQQADRRPKRKSGDISKPGLPSKGAQPLRATRYKVNEALIHPHKKIGLKID